MDRDPPTARPVARVIRAVSLVEGTDMPVRRAFAVHGGNFIDPFLMLDHFGPLAVTPKSEGFPPHPHRGFETVTYLFSGAIEHHDSVGGHAVIEPGDVQWMTAGAGIVHSETVSETVRQAGGMIEGLQLWVNLPRALRMTTPGHQYIPSSSLPEVADEARGMVARIIAGEVLGTTGAAVPRSPLSVALFTLEAGGTASIPLDPSHQAAVFVVEGSVAMGRERHHVEEAHTAVFAPGPGPIVLAAVDQTRLLYMAGLPLNEPVAARGPFVMATDGEARQAMLDYQAGRFGTIPA